MEEPQQDPFRIYADLSTPAVITDADYRIVFLNRSAEAFWDTTVEAVMGQYPQPALRLAPPDQRDMREWAADVFFPALAASDPFLCRVTEPGGRDRTISFLGTRFLHDGKMHLLLTVLNESRADALSHAPNWALTDPLTGLHNRHQWERELPERSTKPGALIFFDLDGLKEINDLGGHRAGDEAIAVTGRALAAEAPQGALVVRYGGDEFVMVVDSDHAGDIADVAKRVVGRAAEAAEISGMTLPLNLSFGIASFAPGGIEDAVERADDSMYEHKGVLMRGSGAGRIILTRAGRNLVQTPGIESEEQRPGTFATSFGHEFDGYFRQVFARAVEQAREFVAFVEPRAGQAVVEVAAGSGRITFDGGLAERVGPTGQLLVTDPSTAQLKLARKRAHELRLNWVRFVQAPVEQLPLASGTVDLVLGSVFLHFTDPAVALKAMACIVRPGGQVAVNAPMEMWLGDGWRWALKPVKDELEARGRPFRDIFPSRAELEAAIVGAGLVIDHLEVSDPERVQYSGADIAMGVTRQMQFVRLFLREVPDERVRALEQVFDGRIREGFTSEGPDWTQSVRGISILAHRPG